MLNKKIDLVVIGAGISGLSFAYRYKQKYPSKEIEIFEKSHRCGGCIQKTNGFENGPHIFQAARAKPLLELIEAVSLEKELLFSNKAANRRFTLENTRLTLVPSTPKEFFFSTYFPLLLQALFRDFFAKKGEADETIYDFCSRRFGEKLTLKLFDPLARGIWAGEIKNLSITACLPFLKELEKEGSVLKGILKKRKKKKTQSQKGLFTLQKGIASLTEKLGKELSAYLHYGYELKEIKKIHEGYLLKVNEEFVEAKKVVFALPLSSLKKIMKDFDEKIFSHLDTIPLSGVKMMNVRYSENIPLPQGFGYLVPGSENEAIVGVIFDSMMFEKQNQKPLLTVMLKKACEDVEKETLKGLKKHLGIDFLPESFHISDFSSAIPQYIVGHNENVLQLKASLSNHPNMHLLGNFLEGVSVSECIQQAKDLVAVL